jgi:5'-3' exonuclease
MAKYLLVDTANTFFRARHIAHRGADTWDKMGIAVHITLNSVLKCWNNQNADHVVFALEGRSWRKDAYDPYKKNRAVSRAALTEREQEEDKLFWEIFDDLTTFLKDKTNCSVVRSEIAEADDVIARWIATHPNDEHCVVSSDTDFIQLLDENVHQYNGITQELHTLKGIFNDKGERVIDKKTKEYKTIPDPQWLLFEKCIRGDTSDNVFSAYPGARKKGTRNKVGMLEAYDDRNSKGYNWNNFMLQRWVDHNDVEHRVLDDYERNRLLIDLTRQPQEVKDFVDTQIKEAVGQKANTMVGAKFLKFCGKYELIKLAEQAARYADFLQARYPQI